ncbi:hypothetical protein LCGC14_1594340 [marine sediment metagenome]|uniref:Uncharacterized protein n=1 Tax=marine sediment metagenome TaxID=412755 RepID=A0A0F9KTS0_9ZZZZ
MAKKCKHKVIQFENDFMTGYWLVRCQDCRLCTSWLPSREAATMEWEKKKVED